MWPKQCSKCSPAGSEAHSQPSCARLGRRRNNRARVWRSCRMGDWLGRSVVVQSNEPCSKRSKLSCGPDNPKSWFGISVMTWECVAEAAWKCS
jgi:hypothetical protein